jgi:hypothetical protein
MVIMFVSSAIGHGFNPWSDQTAGYKLVFASSHLACRDWLARNEDNVSEWSSKFTCG